MIYVPYEDMELSATIFDNSIIHLQVANIVNLLEVFNETEFGYQVDEKLLLMWSGYEAQLAWYGLLCCKEEEARNTEPISKSRLEWHLDMISSGDFSMEKPPWIGNAKIHESHQSTLIGLNPSFYSSIFPDVRRGLKLVWWQGTK